jgi:PGF-pre-PGF domain-containing protein
MCKSFYQKPKIVWKEKKMPTVSIKKLIKTAAYLAISLFLATLVCQSIQPVKETSAQTESQTERKLFVENFDGETDFLFQRGITLHTNMVNGVYDEYYYIYGLDNENPEIIYYRPIPSEGAGRRLYGSEAQEASGLLQSHVQIVESGKSPGDKCLMADLTGLSSVKFQPLLTQWEEVDLVGLRFSVKFDNSSVNPKPKDDYRLASVGIGDPGQVQTSLTKNENSVGERFFDTTIRYGGSIRGGPVFSDMPGWHKVQLIYSNSTLAFRCTVDDIFTIGTISKEYPWMLDTNYLSFSQGPQGLFDGIKIYVDDIEFFTPNPKPSSLEYSVTPENAILGSTVVLKGTLTPALMTNVTAEVSDDNQLWVPLAEIEAVNGSFSYEWKPESVGRKLLRVSWGGYLEYEDAVGATKELNVSNGISSVFTHAKSVALVPFTMELASNDPFLSVSAITLTTREASENISINVEEMIVPSNELPAATDTVYRYLRIEVTPQLDILNASITIRVLREWFSQNNTDPAAISVMHLQSGSWEKLETTQTGQDEKYIFYEAKVTSLSYFAVTGKPTSNLHIFLIIGIIAVLVAVVSVSTYIFIRRKRKS